MAKPMRRRWILLAPLLLLVSVISIVVWRIKSASQKPAMIPIPQKTPPPEASGGATPVHHAPEERPHPQKPLPKPAASGTAVPTVQAPKGPALNPERIREVEGPALSGVEGPQPPESIVVYKELIPKNITIVQFQYQKDIIAPGERTDFDLNGSGFTPEFQRLIKIDPAESHVIVEKMTLVTPNQIHGTLLADAGAPTRFIAPRVLIRGRPVFVAPDPLGIVRPHEVLDASITEIKEDGRSARFEIIANLTDADLQTLRVQTDTAGIVFSDLNRRGPYLVEGSARIEREAAATGAHDLEVFLGRQKVLRRRKLLRVLEPNVGEAGFILDVVTEDRFRCPGTAVNIRLSGSDLRKEDLQGLSARAEGLPIRRATFTFLKTSRLLLTFETPGNAPSASYPLAIYYNGNLAYKKDNVFEVVDAYWLERVLEAEPLLPGKTGLLKIRGRGLTQGFAEGLTVSSDEPGLSFGKVSCLDENTLEVPIQIASNVAPGNYLLTFRFKTIAEVKPRFGSLIYIGP